MHFRVEIEPEQQRNYLSLPYDQRQQVIIFMALFINIVSHTQYVVPFSYLNPSQLTFLSDL